MANYDTSTLFKESSDSNRWMVKIEKKICSGVDLNPDKEYCFNLFQFEKYGKIIHEIVITPYKREYFQDIYHMQMKLSSPKGSTDKMLDLLEDEKLFSLIVLSINGIDISSNENSIVEIIGKPCGGTNMVNILRNPQYDNLEINDKINTIIKEKKYEQYFEKFTGIGYDDRDIYLIIEKCWDICYPRPRRRNTLEMMVKDETIEIVDEGDCYCIAIPDKIAQEFSKMYGTYCYASIRTSSKRCALSIITRPDERIYNFIFSLNKNAQISDITNIVSNQIEIDFRSANSVRYKDENRDVTFAANVIGSKFEYFERRFMEDYIRARNRTDDLDLVSVAGQTGIKIEKVYPGEFPSDEEEKWLINIDFLAICDDNGKTVTIENPRMIDIMSPMESNEFKKIAEVAQKLCKNRIQLTESSLEKEFRSLQIDFDILFLNNQIILDVKSDKDIDWTCFMFFDQTRKICHLYGLSGDISRYKKDINGIVSNLIPKTVVQDEIITEEYLCELYDQLLLELLKHTDIFEIHKKENKIESEHEGDTKMKPSKKSIQEWSKYILTVLEKIPLISPAAAVSLEKIKSELDEQEKSKMYEYIHATVKGSEVKITGKLDDILKGLKPSLLDFGNNEYLDDLIKKEDSDKITNRINDEIVASLREEETKQRYEAEYTQVLIPLLENKYSGYIQKLKADRQRIKDHLKIGLYPEDADQKDTIYTIVSSLINQVKLLNNIDDKISYLKEIQKYDEENSTISKWIAYLEYLKQE